MHYFTPQLRLASELPPQSAPADKLGGLPWGLGAEAWPVCRQCGRSLTPIAQFLHHPQRLDLGREGRMLSVFQCSHHQDGGCESAVHGSGANACFVTEPEDILPHLSALPQDAPPLEREARVTGWAEHDDGVKQEDAVHFLSAEGLAEVSEYACEGVNPETRLGGAPYWIHGPDADLTEGWRFIGQLMDYYEFQQKPGLEPGEFWVEDREEGEVYVCDGPNFGAGIAFLFLRETAGVPEGRFSWQF